MTFIFRGQLCGYICPNTEELLANMTVRLYRPDQEQEVVERATAREKETFRILDDNDVEGKSDRLLTEVETNEEGEFAAEFSDQQEYDGEAIEVDVRTDHVPGEYKEDTEPVQFTITTLQPRWRQTEESVIAYWEYCLPIRSWCRVRSQFDAWVVCGRITVCGSDSPIPDVTVAAFDADIIEDDPLGTDTTDSTGFFRIYYTTADIERTPPLFPDVELTPGPDLFFRITASGGGVLLDEDRDEGRTSGRENVDRCHRVDLCVPIEDGKDPKKWGEDIPTLWTGIGSAFSMPGDFDADGYAESGGTKYALTGGIQFTGSAPVFGPSGAALEYRFLVSETTTSNTAGPLPAGTFTRTIGDDANPDLFADSKLGTILVFVPASGEVEYVEVRSSLADFDPDGWLNVEQAIDRSLHNDPDVGVGLSGVTPLAWDDTDQLMGLDTSALAPNDPDPTPTNVGDSIPDGTFAKQKISVRFETRNAGSLSVGGHGTTLNSMMIDNHSAFKQVSFLPFESADPCAPVSGTVGLAYNVYHGHLGRAWITLQKNTDPSQSIDDNATAAATDKVPVDIDLPGVSEGVHNPSFDITNELDGRCAYIVQLHEHRRLHTGYTDVTHTHTPPIPFFYEP